MADLTPSLRNALADLITANHILDHYHLVDGLGHISLRSPEDPSTFYMTGPQQPPAFVCSETDLAHYRTRDGTSVVVGSGRVDPHDERFGHSGVLQRFPGVNAVVQCSSPAVVAVGVSGVGLKPVYHMAGFLGDVVPVFDIGDVYDGQDTGNATERNMLVNTNELGDRLAASLSPSDRVAHLPEYTVVLQRGRGFVTWGETVEEAVWRAIYTQQNAQIQMSATDFSVVASGELQIQTLSPQEIRGCAALCKSSAMKGWVYWKRLVESNPMYRNDLLNRSIPVAGSYRKTESNRMPPF